MIEPAIVPFHLQVFHLVLCSAIPSSSVHNNESIAANHQSFVGPSVKSVLSTHYSVGRPSTSSDGGTTPSSVVQSTTVRETFTIQTHATRID